MKNLVNEHKQHGYVIDGGDGSCSLCFCSKKELDKVINADSPWDEYGAMMESEFCLNVKVYDDYSVEIEREYLL